MFYADTITKGFLTSGSYIRNDQASRWTVNQDPTYMGFWVHFNPQVATNDNIDMDYLPQGLLMPDGPEGTTAYSDSAISFLKRRGEPYRAAMVEEFRQGLFSISQETPWMFQKITGMGELWKIDPASNWRTKEKKIVLECLETIDLKMSYLVDLYRKAAFDAFYMKYILPDCQRFFKMEIIISEIRTMQLPGGVPYNTATFYNFLLDYCEFDFFSDDIGYMEGLTSFSEGKQATVKMPIKVGRVREFNSYGILGAYLQDTYNASQRNDDQRKQSFAQGTTQNDATGEKVANSRSDFFVQRYEDFNAAAEIDRTSTTKNRDTTRQNSLGEGALGNNGAGTGRPEYKAPINPLLAGALGALNNAIQRVTNGAKLGNVYGFSASGLTNTLQGLLNNPVGAVQGLLVNQGINQDPPQANLTNINLTGQEVQLVEQLIGSATEVANIVAGTQLESKTIGDLIGDIRPSQNLQGVPLSAFNATTNPSQNLQGSPSNAQLTGDIPSATAPGRTNLTGPTNLNVVDPVRIVLDAATGNSSSSVGKVTLSAASSTLDGQTGKVDLSSPPSSAASTNSVELIAPVVSSAQSGNVGLESADPSNTTPGKTVLESSPASPIDSTKVALQSNGAKLEGKAGAVALEGSAKLEGNPGKTVLEGAETNDTQLGKTLLTGAEVGDSISPKKVDLNTAPKPNNSLGNANLQ